MYLSHRLGALHGFVRERRRQGKIGTAAGEHHRVISRAKLEFADPDIGTLRAQIRDRNGPDTKGQAEGGLRHRPKTGQRIACRIAQRAGYDERSTIAAEDERDFDIAADIEHGGDRRRADHIYFLVLSRLDSPRRTLNVGQRRIGIELDELAELVERFQLVVEQVGISGGGAVAGHGFIRMAPERHDRR